MTKHSRYVFEEFPKNLVVNPSEMSDITDEDDDIINSAITQHLQTIVTGEELDENGQKHEIKGEEEVIQDIESIKLESYNKGLDEATTKYETVISDITVDKDLSKLLKSKLEAIKQEINIDKNAIELCTSIIANIAKSICLILPVDFEQIIKTRLLSSLKKFYRSGSIVLSIHPERSGFCRDILKTEELPSKIKENLEIIEDSSVGINDCKLQWQDTTFKYDQEQLSLEVEEIIKQLKDTKNI